MALRIITRTLAPTGGTIIVHGDTQEEVTTPDARKLVLQDALANGVNRAGLSGAATPYPVDADGNTGDDLIFGRNGAMVAGYRADYKVAGMP